MPQTEVTIMVVIGALGNLFRKDGHKGAFVSWNNTISAPESDFRVLACDVQTLEEAGLTKEFWLDEVVENDDLKKDPRWLDFRECVDYVTADLTKAGSEDVLEHVLTEMVGEYNRDGKTVKIVYFYLLPYPAFSSCSPHLESLAKRLSGSDADITSQTLALAKSKDEVVYKDLSPPGPPDVVVMVVIGAYGNLFRRKLHKSLFQAQKEISPETELHVLACDRQDLGELGLSKDTWLDSLGKASGVSGDAAWPEFRERVQYIADDFTRPNAAVIIQQALTRMIQGFNREGKTVHVNYYFALPPTIYLSCFRSLKCLVHFLMESGVQIDYQKLVFEKPVGLTFQAAAMLLHEIMNWNGPVQRVYMDHFGFKVGTVGLIDFLYGTPYRNLLYNYLHVAKVVIYCYEPPGGTDREFPGTLRDSIMNHMMYLFAICHEDPLLERESFHPDVANPQADHRYMQSPAYGLNQPGVAAEFLRSLRTGDQFRMPAGVLSPSSMEKRKADRGWEFFGENMVDSIHQLPYQNVITGDPTLDTIPAKIPCAARLPVAAIRNARVVIPGTGELIDKSGVETSAQLFIDPALYRWARETPFEIRHAKYADRKETGVDVHFRPPTQENCRDARELGNRYPKLWHYVIDRTETSDDGEVRFSGYEEDYYELDEEGRPGKLMHESHISETSPKDGDGYREAIISLLRDDESAERFISVAFQIETLRYLEPIDLWTRQMRQVQDPALWTTYEEGTDPFSEGSYEIPDRTAIVFRNMFEAQ